MTTLLRSYGLAVLTANSSTKEILMVKNVNGGHWMLPKGGIEDGETSLDAAIRETKEETGLSVSKDAVEKEVTFIHDFRFFELGEGAFHKVVEYYPVFAKKTLKLKPQADDVAAARWMTLPTARQMVGFESSRRLIEEIEEWLEDRSTKE